MTLEKLEAYLRDAAKDRDHWDFVGQFNCCYECWKRLAFFVLAKRDPTVLAVDDYVLRILTAERASLRAEHLAAGYNHYKESIALLTRSEVPPDTVQEMHLHEENVRAGVYRELIQERLKDDGLSAKDRKILEEALAE